MKVLWAGSLLRGTPSGWFLALVSRYLDQSTPSPPELESFESFIDALNCLYPGQVHEEDAWSALQTIEQRTSVAEYTARFEAYRVQMGFTGP